MEELIKNNYKFTDSKDILNACKYIDYNSETGDIKHLLRANSNGSIDKDGYLIIKIKGRQYKAHRLAYAKYYNNPPMGVIDHINGIKTDNRILNLRDTSQKENCKNIKRSPNKDTKVIGVRLNKDIKKKKYEVKIMYKTYRFETIEQAVEFRKTNNYQI
jgi:hypothetical protein